MTSSEEAAVEAARGLVEGEETEEVTPSGSDEDEVVFPTFDVELPDDIVALLEEGDEEDLAVSEDEIDALVEENEDVPREILARMKAAEKRAAHLEKLRVGDAKKNWETEASKLFPHARPMLDQIDVTSRRSYLRAAKAINDRYKVYIDNDVLAPAKAAIGSTKEAAVVEGKAEAKKAWGAATPSDEAPSDAQTNLQDNIQRRGHRELSDTIRDMLFPKGAQE